MTQQDVEVIVNLAIDPWVDLRPYAPLTEVDVTRVGMLPAGTVGGHPVVVLLFTLDGKPVVSQIPWRTWQAIHAMLAATPTAQMEDL